MRLSSHNIEMGRHENIHCTRDKHALQKLKMKIIFYVYAKVYDITLKVLEKVLLV